MTTTASLNEKVASPLPREETEEKKESCWNNCKVSCCDLEKWGLNPHKVAKFALALITLCAVAIVVASLMVHYPQAHGSFFTLFGFMLTGSFIIFIVAIVKNHQQNHKGEPLTLKGVANEVKEVVSDTKEIDK